MDSKQAIHDDMKICLSGAASLQTLKSNGHHADDNQVPEIFAHFLVSCRSVISILVPGLTAVYIDMPVLNHVRIDNSIPLEAGL
jgi:hypothetical protein